jgi:Rod binding domain-containing protein
MSDFMTNNLQMDLQSRFAQTENQVSRLQNSFANPSGKDDQKLRKAAQEFEAVFVKQLLDAMDKTVDRTGLLSGGHAEDMFRGMLNDEISKSLSTRLGGSGFGLAETIYRQLSKNVPTQPGGSNG